MTRSATSLALGALVLLALALPAEEPPHLQFVQGLRDKQLPEYGLQYLEDLAKKKLPPEVVAVLPLERAKCRLSLAVQATDPGRRTVLQTQARAEFDAFLKANPNHPLAADANLEIARIVALQGKTQLSQARRAEAADVRQAALLQARAQFQAAAKQLEAAANQINTQLAALADPEEPKAQAEKRSLSQAKLKAEFEQGMNLLDLAQTYSDRDEARGTVIKQAIGILEKVSRRETKNALCWQARAWVGKSYAEIDNPGEARKVLNEVIREPGEHAELARRQARYFLLSLIANDRNEKNPLAKIQPGAESWFGEYRAHLATPEGYGVRYELAEAYLAEALKNFKAQPAKARDQFQRAQKLYQELEQSESDFAETAREKKLTIILTLSEERSKGDIGKLKNFEECFLRAQFEVSKLNKAELDPKADKNKLVQLREEHFRNMVQALNRGLDLADASVSPRDLWDARFRLTMAYFNLDDYYRAVVVGEHLARTAPQSSRAPLAGTLALFSYAQLIGEEERAQAAPEVLEADRSRLRKLADYLEKTWPNDSAADVARHQVGGVCWGEKKYAEAVEALSRITPGYPNAPHASYLLANAALQAHKQELKPPAGKPSYPERALMALQSIPDPAPGAAAATVQVYMEAKLQLGGLLYTAKEFKGLQAVAEALQKKLAAPELGLDDAARNELRPRVKALELLHLYGLADADYRAGQYTKVGETLEPIVKQIRDPSTASQYAEMKNPALVHGLLGLAMRASVQDNKTDKARDLLELLQKVAPDNALDILKDMVRQLSQQVQELREKGAPAREQLDKTVANFALFLDELARQQAKEPKPELILFLADGYSSLDKHGQAAKLLAEVPEPQPEGDGKTVDPKKLGVYRVARILYCRELRLAKQYGKAKAELDRILDTPPRWGQAYLEVKKERIFLLEDQGKFGGTMGAAQEWNRLMQGMKSRVQADARVREQYFECYYHLVNCIYKFALTVPDAAKRRKEVQKAANWIVQLERTQPDMGGEGSRLRFEELLRREHALKEQYEELKKTTR